VALQLLKNEEELPCIDEICIARDGDCEVVLRLSKDAAAVMTRASRISGIPVRKYASIQARLLIVDD